MADLLADATRLPREQIYALRQDADSRWTPPDPLWKVSSQYWHRRCRRCLIDCGVVHDRRAWRSGWARYCPSHNRVFGSEDQTPSPHAVCLESVLIAAIHHPRQQVVLPWPVADGTPALPLPEVLDGLKEGWRFQRGLQDAGHHVLMASLGWLRSDWPENLKRLLQSREFSTLRLAICVEVCKAANIQLLRNRASALVEPLRNALAAL